MNNPQPVNSGYPIISIIIIVLFISIISIVVGSKVKKLRIGDKPSKLLTVFITFIAFFNNFVKNNIGKHWKYVTPFVLTLAIYIFIANISSLFLLDPPTKYTAVTAVLALFSIVTVQTTGMVSRGFKHVKTWFEPMAFMFPLNIMSDITPLISMTLRLFGNIASGAALLYMIYNITGYFSPIAALPLHILFDIGFGLIQTIVFVLLTVIFASNKTDENDLEYLTKGELVHV